MKTISDAIPQSSSRLEKKPIDRSDTRSVRAAIAVPIWQATMPAKVIVVAVRYVVWSGEPTPTGSPGLQPPSRRTTKKAASTSAASIRPSHTQARTSIARLITPSEAGRGGRAMRPGSAASRPSASAGRISVPRSIARICITVSGSGTAPPESAKTRNGITSGVAWAKM